MNGEDNGMSNDKKIADLKHNIPYNYPSPNTPKTVQGETLTYEDAVQKYKSMIAPIHSHFFILGRKQVDIDKSFIPIGIVPDDTRGATPKSSTEEILAEIADVGNSIVIKGAPGTGKTTLAKKIMHDLCDMNNPILPLYFKATLFQEMRIFKESSLESSINSYLESVCRKNVYNILAGVDLFREKSTCVIIDGMDEMRPEWQEVLSEKLKEFTLYNPHCYVIITTRIFGYDADSLGNRFVPYSITELSDTHIENYIRNNIDPQYQDKVVNAIKSDEKLKELAKVPFMLALMCIKPERLHKGATQKAELYKETTEYLLGAQMYEKQRERTSRSDIKILTKALQVIAVRFFKLDMNDQFPADEALFYIAQQMGHGKLFEDESILEIIQKKSGLINYSNGMYSFVHRSIWEYYVALGMLELEPLENLLQMANVPNWEEPIRMYVGLTPTSDLRSVIFGLWKRNKALTLRTLHETQVFPTGLLNELYSSLGQSERVNLVHTLEEDCSSIQNDSYRKRMLIDTVSAVYEAEHDSEVIFNYILLLEKSAYPECISLVSKILDLEHADERRNHYLNGDYAFELIDVKGGSFMQGNSTPIDPREYPAHPVRISDFKMSKNLITNAMFFESFPFVDSERRLHRSPYSNEPLQPVNDVNWYEAYVFARWIGCSLPTEAQWEYCCRSGGADDARFSVESNVSAYGWYGVNSNNRTHKVGEKHPNSFGFCDMLGNLREWCYDWHQDDYYSSCPIDEYLVDPIGPDKGDAKVLRGGCFDWAITNLRPTYRNFNRPNVNYFGNGFRVVLIPVGQNK